MLAVETDGSSVVTAKRLLDHAKLCGFKFMRVASGEDAPIVGHRASDEWVDLIRIEGFSGDCFAWRKRTSSLIVPEDKLIENQVAGSAIDVLNEALTWKL